MKLFSRLLVSSAALLIACNAFASKHQSAEDCPPISTIMSNSTFTRAMYAEPFDMWGMTANNFDYQGTDWNVAFAVTLPDAKTETDALEQGQAFFRDNVVLRDPIPSQQDDYFMCIYAATDNLDYLVVAFNPPMELPGLASFTKKLRK